MTRQRRGVWLRASLAAVLALSTPRALMQAQQTRYPKPSELPNPYRLAEHWPTLPKTMNEGRWGEVIRVHVDTAGHVWVFHRCFNVVPPGANGFDRPTGVAVAANGDIFVSAGHAPNKSCSGRVVTFSSAGRFIKERGPKQAAPGDFDEPHDIFVGGSRGWVYVADRRNNRVEVFDQNGTFIAAWTQCGQPSSVFVGQDDTIYVGASFPDSSAKKGELRGIVTGNAIDGSLKAFIPDPADLDKVIAGTSASGIAADSSGSVYAADVGVHNLRKYVKVK